MRSVVAIFTVLALAGSSDVVTTRFATLADAKSQGAFQRGWLPPVLPDSATAIVERNDLDLNRGTGSFDYDLAERTTYLESLSRVGAVSLAEPDADILAATTNGSRWEIRLPRSSGQGAWSVRGLSGRRTSQWRRTAAPLLRSALGGNSGVKEGPPSVS